MPYCKFFCKEMYYVVIMPLFFRFSGVEKVVMHLRFRVELSWGVVRADFHPPLQLRDDN